MGIEKLIVLAVAATLAVATVSKNGSHDVLRVVQSAQLHLIQDSKASRWGKAMLPQ